MGWGPRAFTPSEPGAYAAATRGQGLMGSEKDDADCPRGSGSGVGQGAGSEGHPGAQTGGGRAKGKPGMARVIRGSS